MPKFDNQVQLELFDLSDTTEDVVELFPEVWQALESLISPDVENRFSGLKQLTKLNAHRLSPIVAYILTTCLDDENIDFRFNVVQTVGALLSRDGEGLLTPFEVKRRVKYSLGKMRQRKVFALLQVADYQPISQSNVALLLKACSFAGKILSDIFTDHKLPIEIRRQAIHFAGYIGFLETIPRLEKLAEKLEARMNGQRFMPFAPTTSSEESSLLPTLQTALLLLKSP